MRRFLLILALCGLAHADPLITSPYDWMRVYAQMNQSITNYVTHSGGVSVTGDWLFVQGTSGSQSGNGGSFQVQNACGGSITATCTIQILPTKLGSDRVIGMVDTSATDVVTILSAVTCTALTGGICDGIHNTVDTASLCATSGCHIKTAVDTIDASYIANGGANATFATVVLSAIPSNDWFVEFMEESPPLCNGTPCATAFDTNATMSATAGTCSTLCTLTGMTLAGTDGIMGIIDSGATVGHFTVPYQIDSVGNVFAVDATSAPAWTVKTSNYITLSNLAFKITGASFSPSAVVFTNTYQAPGDTGGNQLVYQLICTPTCGTLTLPGTSATGHLMALFSGPNANNAVISTVTNGGTWVVPTGASTCQNTSVSTNPLSCGYVLASTSGATTLSIVMSTNCTCNFIFTDVSRSAGSFVLDSQNSSEVATATNPVIGQTLTIVGPDVCFAEFEWTSTALFEFAQQYYPLPGGRNEFGPPGSPLGGVLGIDLNVRSYVTPEVLLSGSTTNSTTSGVCFK